MTARGPWDGAPPEQLANRYYDATTWIYRRAWGASFHFAPLRPREARRDAIRRYERELAGALAIPRSSLCLDLGCGVGGPAATIAAATGARVVGLNANVGQLGVLRRTTRRRPGVDVRGAGGDFARLPFRAGTFDRAYAFEALCHAVDLPAVLREIRRVLRPGGLLGFSEWCLTGAFDANDVRHRALRRQIEASYGVLRLRAWPEWLDALTGAGFHVVESVDRATPGAGDAAHEPWYRALLPRDATLDSLARRGPVRGLQEATLALAERTRLAPRGTVETVRLLRAGTAALLEAGQRGIFTPMQMVVARDERGSTRGQ
jgi:sterol 24-C-methyltransferase